MTSVRQVNLMLMAAIAESTLTPEHPVARIFLKLLQNTTVVQLSWRILPN